MHCGVALFPDDKVYLQLLTVLTPAVLMLLSEYQDALHGLVNVRNTCRSTVTIQEL